MRFAAGWAVTRAGASRKPGVTRVARPSMGGRRMLVNDIPRHYAAPMKPARRPGGRGSARRRRALLAAAAALALTASAPRLFAQTTQPARTAPAANRAPATQPAGPARAAAGPRLEAGGETAILPF